jgi:hypothetical protein
MFPMIENLELAILHLKAVRQPEDLPLPICASSPAERSNTKKTTGRIPQVLKHSQSNFPSSPKGFKRNLNLLKAEVDSDSTLFPGKSRNMGGVSFTCDASPHSPRSIVSSRKSGVGAGLLVHLTAHIAETDKTTSSIQTNVKTTFQHFEHAIELFFFRWFFLDTFAKNKLPWYYAVTGDIRRPL